MWNACGVWVNGPLCSPFTIFAASSYSACRNEDIFHSSVWALFRSHATARLECDMPQRREQKRNHSNVPDWGKASALNAKFFNSTWCGHAPAKCVDFFVQTVLQQNIIRPTQSKLRQNELVDKSRARTPIHMVAERVWVYVCACGLTISHQTNKMNGTSYILSNDCRLLCVAVSHRLFQNGRTRFQSPANNTILIIISILNWPYI